MVAASRFFAQPSARAPLQQGTHAFRLCGRRARAPDATSGAQISGASLLDEATAAAEAMTMCSAAARGKKPVFLVSVRGRGQLCAAPRGF